MTQKNILWTVTPHNGKKRLFNSRELADKYASFNPGVVTSDYLVFSEREKLRLLTVSAYSGVLQEGVTGQEYLDFINEALNISVMTHELALPEVEELIRHAAYKWDSSACWQYEDEADKSAKKRFKKRLLIIAIIIVSAVILAIIL